LLLLLNAKRNNLLGAQKKLATMMTFIGKVMMLALLTAVPAEESCEETALIQRDQRSQKPLVLGNHSFAKKWSVLPTQEQIKRAMDIHKKVSQKPKGPLPSCSVDLRHSLPACMQYTPDWCWATVTAQLAGYFDPTHNPESGDFEDLGTGSLNREVQHAESCLGEECRIVGSQFAPSIQAACCTEQVAPARSSYECDTGADVDTIEKAIDWATSQSYKAHEGALSEEDLVRVLNQGHPVPYAVLWVDKASGMFMGGHIMILGGCTGDGKYYLHDSLSNLTRTSPWQELTHDELMQYNPWAMVDAWPTVEQLNGKPIEEASNKDLKEWFLKHGTLGTWFSSFLLNKDEWNLHLS